MSRRRIAQGWSATIADKMVVAITQLVSVPLLSLHWGVELYGLWSMLFAIPYLLALGDFGFASAATAQVTMEVARGNMAGARAAYHGSLRIVAFFTAALFIFAGFACFQLPDTIWPNQAGFSPDDARMTAFAFCCYALLVVLDAMALVVFRSTGAMALGTVINSFTLAAETTVIALIVLKGGGLAAAALGMLGARAGGVLAMSTIAWSRSPELRPGLRKPDQSVTSALVPAAMAGLAITLGNALLIQGSVLALGLAAGAAAVPAFIAARTLARLALQGAQTLALVLMPEFAVAMARGETERANTLVGAVALVALVLASPIALGLAIWGPELIALWSGGALEAGRGLMIAMGLSALAGALWAPLSNLILAINRQGSFSYFFVLAAAITCLGIYCFSVRFGNVSAGVAFAALDLTMLAIVAIAIARICPNALRPSQLAAAGQLIISRIRR